MDRYQDGSIRVWDSRLGTVMITFNGHKSAVTHLRFDKSGVRLASGAKDTDIILWDLVAEVGMFKLRGHKDQITSLEFVEPGNTTDNDGIDRGEIGSIESASFILSTSKDALIKLWDLSTQHCIETHVAQTNGECWSMGVSPDYSGCITAGNDGELKVWAVDLEGLRSYASATGGSAEQRYLHDRGILYRQGKDRTTGIVFHPRQDYIAIHGPEKAVELWRVRNETEILRSLARKRRRRREKLGAAAEKNEEADTEMNDGKEKTQELATAEVSDVFVPYTIVRTGGKVSSVDWVRYKGHKSIQLLVAASNNCLESYTIPTKDSSKVTKSDELPDYSRTHAVDVPGHRADVRALALSSDDRMLASAANGSLKIWNTRTRSCLRTLECGYALCCAFLPGDKIVVVGNKNGELELFDIASSALIERMSAHEGAIWTLSVHPDGRSIVTGSADKSAKFWDFQIIQEEIPGTKRTTPKLQLVHKRTLKVNDDLFNLCFSPDGRLLAVSTLDNTVRVFFTDTLKLFLHLYGHKLPVLNMSISSDSKLIATCSADKNVRLWGLDFGDCHKAFFAHNDSVMQVLFVREPEQKEDSHLLFSASKDGLIKSWDGDKFQHVQTLAGHHGEIWSLVASRTGEFLVSASHDKSIRIWTQTDEPLFLEEEREREMEELYESTLAANLDNDAAEQDGDAEVGAPGRQTTATLTAGEKIIEALDKAHEDLLLMTDYHTQQRDRPNEKIAPPQRDPLFLALGNISAERHVLNTISKIPAASLQDALLVLPFSILPQLFDFIAIFVRRQWNVPLVCRVLFFMLRTHQRQIVASKELKGRLEGMRTDLKNTLMGMKDLMGFNLAAVGVLGDRLADGSVVRLDDVEEIEERKGRGRKKRTFVDVA